MEAVADEAVLAAENTAGANTDIGNIKALLTDNDDIVSATVGLGLVEKYDALATTKANLSSKTSITNAFNSGIRILKSWQLNVLLQQTMMLRRMLCMVKFMMKSITLQMVQIV